MARLLDVWLDQKDFFEGKTLEQVVSMAGDGILTDGSEASDELRVLFANIQSDKIEEFMGECLSRNFRQSGLVLQDLVNEIGKRLGFAVEPGYYRGSINRIGFDGIWQAKDGYCFIIEVKTTDAFNLDLSIPADYRKRLIEAGRVNQEISSILLVVGRDDTGSLEAQTRGSRYAWDIRIISIDSLLRLLRIKEDLADLATVIQIQEILKPVEYTRVDGLIDIIFKTSEDLKSDDLEEESEASENGIEELGEDKEKPVKYHEQCVEKISSHLKTPLIKQGRCAYASSDQLLRILCIISKEYWRSGTKRYWYAFHPTQQEFLNEGKKSFIGLGCGSAEEIILMPSGEFQKYLPLMRKTESSNRYYWHVEVFNKDEHYLLIKPTEEGIDVTHFLMK